MIDVFVRVYVENDLREAMAKTVIARWRLQKDAHTTLFLPCWKEPPFHFRIDGLDRQLITGERYHIESKSKAEELATSDIYVVADDDQLILGQDWISKGCSILSAHPEYGMLCGWNICEHTRDYWNPAAMLEDVKELHSIGCPYFVRKGTLKIFPEVDKGYYDGALSKVVTDQGLKTGVMPSVQYNHLGFGYSSIVDWNWGA